MVKTRMRKGKRKEGVVKSAAMGRKKAQEISRGRHERDSK